MKNVFLFLILALSTVNLSAQCTLPDPLPCNDLVNINLDRIDGTASLTPEMVLGNRIDPCVFDLVEVSPSTFDCSNVGSNFFVVNPVGEPDNLLCFGRVIVEDKAEPVIQGCPTTNLYRSLAPNTSETITLADLGVTAVDNCTASPTLRIDPDPFVITSADHNDTVYAYVIAEDEYNNVARCRIGVAVTVDNCSSGEAAPENLAVALVGTDIVFTWDEVVGFTDYAVGLEEFSRKNGSGKWKAVKNIPPAVTGTSFAVPLADLVVDSLHRFSVEVSGGGNNCRAVLEFVPNELSGTPLSELNPSNRPAPLADQSFQVFPNPANDLLQLYFPEALSQLRRIRLLDLQGHTVRELVAGPQARTAQMEVDGLPAGLYIVQVQGGSKSVAKKILIQ